MKHYRILLAVLIASLTAFAACDDPLNPEENFRNNLESVLMSPAKAEGIMLYGYTQMPYITPRFDDVATDDAVSNNPANTYRTMATGGWSSLSNAQDMWTQCNRGIMNLNRFFTIVDQIDWKPSNERLAKAFKSLYTGEAYALRGILKYFELRNHAGVSADGELLGIPIYNEYVTDLATFSEPRKTFTESVQSIMDDFTEALKYIPMDYGDVTSVPSAYNYLSLDEYNNIFGDQRRQKVSGRIVKAFQARVALLAASPAFNQSNTASLWETAAKYAGDLLKDIGGIAGLDPTGNVFWLPAQITAAKLRTGDNKDLPEIIWRRYMRSFRDWEQDNYPPTVYGYGRINPTQNFVDAFPMKNGYPIDDAASGYDPQNPYANRDPRLAQIVVLNGSKVRGSVINSLTGSSNDLANKMQYSTRTGYYLRKHLNENVNVQTGKQNTQDHIEPIIRYTEIFLDYAEAANEAWGPDGKGSYGFSARDVVAAIRKRAGINEDAYLATISSKEDMRKLIRNERRIELSFEGFRFWDLRRWNVALDEPAMGVELNDGVYTEVEVEDRAYKPYMVYGPIPYNEVLKFGFVQNKGWE
ncbi:MAG: RagB/SusD family nutrient uptake outer membrane protein [Bacteroidales bacterium]|nr:RagB/SusD family nutrient uptake outer membrane protein [Bacteroidales bacterium]